VLGWCHADSRVESHLEVIDALCSCYFELSSRAVAGAAAGENAWHAIADGRHGDCLGQWHDPRKATDSWSAIEFSCRSFRPNRDRAEHPGGLFGAGAGRGRPTPQCRSGIDVFEQGPDTDAHPTRPAVDETLPPVRSALDSERFWVVAAEMRPLPSSACESLDDVRKGRPV